MLPLKNVTSAAVSTASDESGEKLPKSIDPRLYELQKILQSNEAKLTTLEKKTTDISKKINKLNEQLDKTDTDIFKFEEDLTTTAVVIGSIALTAISLPFLIWDPEDSAIFFSIGPGLGIGYLVIKYWDGENLRIMSVSSLDFLKKTHPHLIPRQIKTLSETILKIQWKHPKAYKTETEFNHYNGKLETYYVGTINDFEKSIDYVTDKIEKIISNHPYHTVQQVMAMLNGQIDKISNLTL